MKFQKATSLSFLAEQSSGNLRSICKARGIDAVGCGRRQMVSMLKKHFAANPAKAVPQGQITVGLAFDLFYYCPDKNTLAEFFEEIEMLIFGRQKVRFIFPLSSTPCEFVQFLKTRRLGSTEVEFVAISDAIAEKGSPCPYMAEIAKQNKKVVPRYVAGECERGNLDLTETQLSFVFRNADIAIAFVSDNVPNLFKAEAFANGIPLYYGFCFDEKSCRERLAFDIELAKMLKSPI